MMSAKMMSEKIRMKRKKIEDDGLENAVDTAPGPQMNPQDILNLKQQAQMRDTMDIEDPHEGPSDPADPELDGTQEMSELKKRMARIEGIFNKLSMSK